MMLFADFLKLLDKARIRRPSSPSLANIVPASPAIFTLIEGDYAQITASANSSGTVVATNTDGVVVGNWSLIAGQRAIVGPRKGTHTVKVTCATGSMSAEIENAVLGATQLDEVYGFRSALGVQLPLLAANTFAIAGTSRDMQNMAIATSDLNGGTVTNGIMTVPLANHQMIPGERINIAAVVTVGGLPRRDVNRDYRVLELVDAGLFRVDLGDPSINGAVVGGINGTTAFQIARLRYSNSAGYWPWIEAMLGGAIELVDNFAIGGVGFDDPVCGILAQLQRAIATGAANIIIGDPINNINAQLLSDDQIWAFAETAYRMCRAANRVAWFTTCRHLGNVYSTYGNAAAGYTNQGHKVNTRINAYNKRLKRFAQRNTGIVVLPFAEITVETADVTVVGGDTRSTGIALTGAIKKACTADGIHDNAYGGRMCGTDPRTISEFTKRFPAIRQSPYSAIESNTLQGALGRYVNSNPLFNTGIEAAGLAADWSGSSSTGVTAVTSTSDRTLAADGDNAGKNQKFVLTAPARAGGSSYDIISAAPVAQFSVTDVMRAMVEVLAIGMSGVTSISATLTIPMKNSLGVNVNYAAAAFLIGAGFDNSDMPRLLMKTRDLVFPGSYSNAGLNGNWKITVTFGAAGGGATLSIALGSIEKVQPLQ